MSRQTRVRNLLEEQILTDAKNGDRTVLVEILEQLSDDVAYASLSDFNQENLNFQQLRGGENIKALKDVKCISNSYSTPELIVVTKGSLLQVPHGGTRMGDCFTNLVSGDAVITLRGGSNTSVTRDLKRGDTVGLSEGYDSAPYSLGRVDLRIWEIIK